MMFGCDNYDSGYKRRGNNLLVEAELAIEGVPAGRYDRTLRLIGLDRISKMHLRTYDSVPGHVRTRAEKLISIDDAFENYKSEQKAALIFDARRSQEMREYLTRNGAPEFLPRLKNQDSKVLRDIYIRWMGVRRMFLNGQMSKADYHNATLTLEKSLQAYETAHDEKLTDIEAKVKVLKRA